MRAAPAFQVSLQRFGVWRAAVIGVCGLGVAVIAGVGTLSNHIESGIKSEAKTMLGGDAELVLTNLAATPEQVEFLKQFGRVSRTVSGVPERPLRTAIPHAV